MDTVSFFCNYYVTAGVSPTVPRAANVNTMFTRVAPLPDDLRIKPLQKVQNVTPFQSVTAHGQVDNVDSYTNILIIYLIN